MSQEKDASASMEAHENTADHEQSPNPNLEGSTQASATPTSEVYAELERAYAFFNDELFDGRLPPCMITLQRSHDTLGYFSADRFVKRASKGSSAHEIALNPSYFAIRSIPETLSVLVREMVSLDQHLHSAKPPRRRYRNREWADMAEAIGLMPSDTGVPGGKRTGDGVQTYIIDGGLFDVACAKLLDDAFVLSWLDRYPPAPTANPAPPVDAPAPQPSEGGITGLSMAPSDDDGDIKSEPDELIAASDAASPDNEGLLDGTWETLPSAPASASPDELGKEEGSKRQPDAPPPPPMKAFAPVDIDVLEQSGITPVEKPKNSSKSKFSCPACGANVWGRAALRVQCEGTETKQHDATRMELAE